MIVEKWRDTMSNQLVKSKKINKELKKIKSKLEKFGNLDDVALEKVLVKIEKLKKQ
jgi:hypothetical protein